MCHNIDVFTIIYNRRFVSPKATHSKGLQDRCTNKLVDSCTRSFLKDIRFTRTKRDVATKATLFLSLKPLSIFFAITLLITLLAK